MLTVAYITSRKEPMIEWFFNSLHRECKGNYVGLDIVVVDFWKDDALRAAEFRSLAKCDIRHVAPKPTVWQGPNRLTTQDYFCPANARNTAVCLAKDGWIAFVDDLSVLMPGWLASVWAAMEGDYIALGSYKKVNNIVVDQHGHATYTEFPPGIDSRLKHCERHSPGQSLVPAAGSWMFGCSFAAPVEALLSVNGSDENCDGVGGEDYMLGMRLQSNGCRFFYDLRMLTLESEELHHVGPVFKRIDKGTSPNDKSHSLLHMARDSKWAANYFGEEGLRGLRKRIQAGEPFPIMRIPEHDWYDGQPLREM